MRKLGISIKIEEDTWRKHIQFDMDSETGAFTADFIEPSAHISFDMCDFHVNALSIKKNILGSLGLKFPMKLIPMLANKGSEKHLSLEEVVEDCVNGRMIQIRPSIFEHRLQKFRDRGWNIDNTIYEPVVFQSKETVFHRIDPSDFLTNICPDFKATLPNATI